MTQNKTENDVLASIYGKRAYLAAAEIDRMVAEYFSNASTSSIKEDIAGIILRHFPHDETVLTLDELEKI